MYTQYFEELPDCFHSHWPPYQHLLWVFCLFLFFRHPTKFEVVSHYFFFNKCSYLFIYFLKFICYLFESSLFSSWWSWLGACWFCLSFKKIRSLIYCFSFCLKNRVHYFYSQDPSILLKLWINGKGSWDL